MTIYDACEKLNKLAKKRGPAGVARAMRLTGCSGIPQDPCHCVIAEYLGRKCRPTGLTVGSESAGWDARGFARECYYFGEQLEAFIGNFDAGDYPELEANPCE